MEEEGLLALRDYVRLDGADRLRGRAVAEHAARRLADQAKEGRPRAGQHLVARRHAPQTVQRHCGHPAAVHRVLGPLGLLERLASQAARLGVLEGEDHLRPHQIE